MTYFLDIFKNLYQNISSSTKSLENKIDMNKKDALNYWNSVILDYETSEDFFRCYENDPNTWTWTLQCKTPDKFINIRWICDDVEMNISTIESNDNIHLNNSDDITWYKFTYHDTIRIFFDTEENMKLFILKYNIYDERFNNINDQ